MLVAIITTIDNATLLREQIPRLQHDLEPFNHRIVVVNNGSVDETAAWLKQQTGLTVIHKENDGAGPGRNAGLDAGRDAEYFFMLDGGILPMVNSIPVMVNYLEEHPATDVIAPPWESFTSDRSKATRRLPSIDEATVYRRLDLSMTAYCLARNRAFDPFRFSEEGPFGEPGWGVDDNEMAAQWWRAGIVVEIFQGSAPFRRASGSFRRLQRETGIWPNQYGSVYEKRFVKYIQEYPDHWDNGIRESLIIESQGQWQNVARLIIKYRDQVQTRHHEIVVVPDGSPEMQEFVYRHALRQHHGDTTVSSRGTVIRRNSFNNKTWCGNFKVSRTVQDAVDSCFQHEHILLGDPISQTYREWAP